MRFKSKKKRVVPTGKTFKKKRIIWLVVALSLFLTVGVVRAGSLTPSGAPASTMRTLQEIYDSLAGTFDSTNSTATSTGSLVQILRYISNNLTFVSSSGNAVFTGAASSTSFQAGSIQFQDATGTNARLAQLVVTNGSSTIGGLNFFNATGTNIRIAQIVSTASSTISGLNFFNATGTNLLFTTASGTNFQAGNIQFQDATGTNARLAQLVVLNGSSTIGGLNFFNATGTNLNGTQLVFTGSSTISALNFFNATGTNAVFTGVASSTNFQSGGLAFNNATGTNILAFGTVSSTNASHAFATTSALSITASGTSALYITGNPQALASTSLIRFGQFDIVGGHASGTYLGLNTPFFNGNFIDFQISSTSKFKVDTLGNLTGGALSFTNATGTSITTTGSSTISALNFFNATGTNAVFTGVASSTNFQSGGLQFANATGTNATLTGILGANTITPSAAMTIGALTQNLTIQGATTTISSTSTGPIIFQTIGGERLRITSSSFIGIGTTTPAYGLTIGDGSTQKDALISKGFLCVDSNNAGCPVAGTATSVGSIFASTTAINAIDLAENYPTKDDSIEAGDIVAFDAVNEENIVKATQDSADQVVGIISTAPGVLLGRKVENSRALALSGRVPVKISDEGGAIKIGDPIILSSVPGVGMKGTSGRIVGYALQNWVSGTGKISVFVKLQASPTEPTVLDQIRTSLNKLGLIIETGILKVKTLVADLIQSKRVETDTIATNKLEMKDVDTGTLYCVQIKSGEWVKTPGACGSDPSAVQVVTPPPANNNVTPPPPPPPTETTSTPDTDSAETSTDATLPPPAPDTTTSPDVQAP